VPSILVKMLGQGFEQQWSIRRRASSEADQSRMRHLIGRLPMNLEARIRGTQMHLRDLLKLAEGDIVSLEVPVRRPVDLSVNGLKKFEGEIVIAGSQRGMVVDCLSDQAT
jgi:flagellar motor switch protein FliM